MYIYVYIYIYVYMYVYIYMYFCTYLYIYMYSHIYMYICIEREKVIDRYAYIYIHIYIYTYTHAHTHRHARIYIYTYTYTCVYSYTLIYTPTCICIYTYIQLYIYVYACVDMCIYIRIYIYTCGCMYVLTNNTQVLAHCAPTNFGMCVASLIPRWDRLPSEVMDTCAGQLVLDLGEVRILKSQLATKFIMQMTVELIFENFYPGVPTHVCQMLVQRFWRSCRSARRGRRHAGTSTVWMGVMTHSYVRHDVFMCKT